MAVGVVLGLGCACSARKGEVEEERQEEERSDRGLVTGVALVPNGEPRIRENVCVRACV